MQSQQLDNSQPGAELRPVGDSVGYLATEVRDFLSCPWCGGLLPASKTKPRKYCTEAHEKAFKRARCVSKEVAYARKLAATNAEFSHYYFHKQLGTYVRDTPERSAEKVSKDHSNRFSRCLQCGTKFTSEKGRPTLSAFRFCGETVLENGPCKAAWIAAHPNVSVPTPYSEPTPVREIRRYTSPSNAYPAEEKLMRVIFGKRGRE